ncbi:MAG: NAD(P)-binding protein [Actinomycetota bacterium]|nr:NAD(P)-binding protein [Actinomycetota bacterium]
MSATAWQIRRSSIREDGGGLHLRLIVPADLIDVVVEQYGAGIAGLTAAHEFSRRGWAVTVYEAKTEAGGFLRSARGAGQLVSPAAGADCLTVRPAGPRPSCRG